MKSDYIFKRKNSEENGIFSHFYNSHMYDLIDDRRIFVFVFAFN